LATVSLDFPLEQMNMATLTEPEARLEAKAQRDSAVVSVSYDGRSAEYRSTAEIARATAELGARAAGVPGQRCTRT
jgi:hypothetical protein